MKNVKATTTASTKTISHKKAPKAGVFLAPAEVALVSTTKATTIKAKKALFLAPVEPVKGKKPVAPIKAVAPAEKAPSPIEKGDISRQSGVTNPTKAFWFMMDDIEAEQKKKGLPMLSRKESIDECVKRGIAYNTARTQYQIRFSLQKSAK